MKKKKRKYKEKSQKGKGKRKWRKENIKRNVRKEKEKEKEKEEKKPEGYILYVPTLLSFLLVSSPLSIFCSYILMAFTASEPASAFY